MDISTIKPERKCKQFSFALTESDYKRLKELCTAAGVRPSDFVRHTTKAAINQAEKSIVRQTA